MEAYTCKKNINNLFFSVKLAWISWYWLTSDINRPNSVIFECLIPWIGEDRQSYLEMAAKFDSFARLYLSL